MKTLPIAAKLTTPIANLPMPARVAQLRNVFSVQVNRHK
jgi:hypothetical protein